MRTRTQSTSGPSVTAAPRRARTLAGAAAAALLLSAAPPAGAATVATIAGELQRITVADRNDHWSGGTMVVGGQTVVVPRNLLIDLPANRLTLQQLFAEAPPACLATGETGLAKADTCNLAALGAMVSIAANRTNGGNVIAGDILVEKGTEAVTGAITYVDHADGYFRVGGNPGDPATGTMVRLNDPSGRHTVQRGKGCGSGPNCSADPRFTLDPDNYTSTFSSGYPLCIPSTVARTFVDVLGLGTTTAQAQPNGTGDVLCPATNRPATGPAADSRRMAPVKVGDSVTAEGNFETVNGVRFLSAHTTMVLGALGTSPAPGQPDYLFLEEAFIDAPGFQNERVRSLFIGFTTASPADVMLWSIHYDPGTNSRHEFPLGTTAGCDAAAGPATCSGQGLVAGSADIFRIRHDVDFLTGAKPRLNPCAHLLADPRFPAGVCPEGGAAETTTKEMFAILSPTPHEIQARTGRKFASLQPGGTPLLTLDVAGQEAPNGQYLFPFGINLGGLDIANAFEFNLNAVNTPFSFSGLPWLLDRRLSPGGCLDTDGDGTADCETTPQPLDPFPFEALDPRTQAAIPAGAYADPTFTASTLSRTADRVLSFVDPVLGTFNGDATRLAWPPPDPAATTIAVTPSVDLACAIAPPPNSPPVATADSAITLAGAAVTIPVLANDSDPEGSPLSVTAVTPGRFGAVLNNGTSVTFIPAAGFAGSDAFTYTISDGAGGSATAPVSVLVLAPSNAAPVATDDTTTATAGTEVVIPVLINDNDPDGDPLTVTLVGAATSGTVTNNGVSVSYLANTGFSGTDTFTYTIADGRGGVATAKVTVTVSRPVEVIAVTLAEFRTGGAEWRVTGTSTAVGATVTIHIGRTLTGPVLGTAVVDAVGNWSFRQKGSTVQPDATRTVSIESNRGAKQLAVPLTVRN